MQTGIGDVEVKVSRVRDRNGDGITFSSALLLPYLKRTRSVTELIPWHYLEGVSTGNYHEALSSLLGKITIPPVRPPEAPPLRQPEPRMQADLLRDPARTAAQQR